MVNLLSDLSSLGIFLAQKKLQEMRMQRREETDSTRRMIIQENVEELMSLIDHVVQSRNRVWEKLNSSANSQGDDVKGGEGTD